MQRELKRRFVILGLIVVFACFFAGNEVVFAHGAGGTTIIGFSSLNPVLVAGNDVTITTTTTSVGHPEKVDEGKVTIQLATDGSGGPPYVPVSAALVTTWVSLNAPGQSPSSGVTTYAVDLDSLGFVCGTIGGFRAHYVTGGGSDRVNTHFSLGVDLQATCPPPPCSGLNIGATLADGNGTPCPGDSVPWTFRITLNNCTGVDLTGVKVQGGSNGWAPMTGYAVSAGTVIVRSNNRNQVLTWTVDIDDGETEYIDVTVDGTIPLSTICTPCADLCTPVTGSIRYISGPWSAVYDDGSGPQKTSYTGRVSLTVVCECEPCETTCP